MIAATPTDVALVERLEFSKLPGALSGNVALVELDFGACEDGFETNGICDWHFYGNWRYVCDTIIAGCLMIRATATSWNERLTPAYVRSKPGVNKPSVKILWLCDNHLDKSTVLAYPKKS